MRAFVALFGVCLAIHLALAGVVVAEGFLFHWLFPALDVRTGVLLSAGVTIASVVFFFKMFGLFMSVPSLAEAATEAEEETEDDEEEEDDDRPDTPSGHHVSPPLRRPRDRRRRRRR
jgi:hypothetical protein